MKPFSDCIPCYLKQMLSVLRAGGVKEEDIPEMLNKGVLILPELSRDANPAVNSSLAVLEAYSLMNNHDPFKEAKKESNIYAMSIYQELKDMIESSEDKLLAAFKVSCAGNIIDMGISPDFDIQQALDEILTKEFKVCDYEDFMGALKSGRKILMLGDNSGEIVFDKLLIEQLLKRGAEVTYSVKSYPTLNDATMTDAVETGLTELVRVIETGSNYVGATPGSCSPEFREEYMGADIVIAKGQANYESLESTSLAGDKTFFILRAKCPCIAKHLGAELGDIVFKRNLFRT